MFSRLFSDKFARGSQGVDLLLAIGVIGLVCLLVIPLPPFLLDTCLVLSILLSVMTLLLTLYIEEPLEFSVFPALLLFLTLYRLALNIASTRMILTHQVAGDIIHTFGEFVISGSSFVGLILFALLTVINFVIVSKGAGRIAEVAARFNLEALSGKQMALDSDIGAGIVSHEESLKLRNKITAESDFYGAMDGASKFVRGDAICSCIITGVNLVGGFIVGIIAKGLSVQECWNTISRLTIGDGLVNQIPALLISMGSAIMVTRVSKSSLGKVMPLQLFTHPRVILLTAIFSLILCIIPGMPLLVLLPISSLLFWYSYTLSKKQKKEPEEKVVQSMNDEDFVYPITIELSGQLLHLIAPLQMKLPAIRRKFTTTLGVRLPAVHITDNLELKEGQYTIKIKEATVFVGKEKSVLEMVESIDKVIQNHVSLLLTRQDVSYMIEKAKNLDSAVVKELLPDKLKLGQLLKILQNLLKEQISIRDFVTILEAIADHLCDEKLVDLDLLTEKVRKSLARNISQTFIGKTKVAHAITVDAKVQQMLKHSSAQTPLRPAMIAKITKEMIRLTTFAREKSLNPIVITASFARAPLKRLIENELPQLPVLAFEELDCEIKIEDLGKITMDVLT